MPRPAATSPHPRRRDARWFPLLVVAAVAATGLGMVTACGSGEETSAASADEPRLDPATFEGEALTVAGEPYDLGALAGQDLVIWFWAPW